jgi:hypothetical protein
VTGIYGLWPVKREGRRPSTNCHRRDAGDWNF